MTAPTEAPKSYAYAGSLPTVIDRSGERASRARRAASDARAAAAAAKLAAAKVKAATARASAAASRERVLAHRIATGTASLSQTKVWAHRLVRARGWSDEQWRCLDKLWTLESNWDPREENDSSGAYGIPQSLPAGKMATVASDWRNNIDTQIRWGLRYIAGRYGTPCNAWAHSRAHNWY